MPPCVGRSAMEMRWHPIRIRLDWLRDTGLPRLQQLATAVGKPMPALCPRIRLRLTDTPLPEEQRVAGRRDAGTGPR